MGVTLAVVGSVAAAGAGAVAANDAKQDTQDAIKREQKSRKQAQVANEKRLENEEARSSAAKERDTKRAKQKRNALSAQGRASTILTSPLGATGGSSNSSAGNQTGGGKTLLGA